MEDPFKKPEGALEQMVQKATDIIKNGKFVVKGFGPDEGKFFVGKSAKLFENGMMTIEYSKFIKDKIPESLNVTYVFVGDFLEWQKLKILTDL